MDLKRRAFEIHFFHNKYVCRYANSFYNHNHKINWNQGKKRSYIREREKKEHDDDDEDENEDEDEDEEVKDEKGINWSILQQKSNYHSAVHFQTPSNPNFFYILIKG